MPTLEQITTTDAPAPSAAYSQAIAWDRLIVTGGQVGADPATGELPARFEDEVRQALRNLIAVLSAAGTGPEHVIKTTCFLTDIATFGQFNAIYQEFFSDPLPARSTVGIALAGDLRFEIEAWAVRGLPSEEADS